ncbi:tax1-binding protein 1 homolog B isoform X1 [Cyclopterus lumpus]|uniref:tax1-binding protein 1 homolog B isoform X1 n=1 Tax=Cyclopterus lumpus TaxID=8103 RepID=UPI0014867C54|nr:tax1-binding protein 1 homolog B isoform X1 [Cyclopterus lumpus]XP_034408811.1 tax1-binding protein 1 homolog B isoform X1 [Cyclopterus lumpus]
MALFLDRTLLSTNMDTSNFAHVIFQNVGKSYMPHAAVECHYTLTQFIKPHPKDWVGIFKVGWSTARDYYTFLWSPLPENYVEGTAVNRTAVFQGYYVPNDDAEFYQFCYVTHKGEIRGASTPFQFRANSPSEDELLTVEDECNSDILVVTTKASFFEQKLEEAQREKGELVKNTALLLHEKEQLEAEKESLQKECEQEKETCAELRRESQDLQNSSQALQEVKEEVKRRLEEATARVIQLEEDLIGVTQKGLQKETELDSLKDRVKKVTAEKEALESHLKNEKDEKELYKIHLKNRELENNKLSAELQMLKSVDVNKENTIAQFKEEVGRLQACLTEKDKQYKEILAKVPPLGDMKAMKEKLRQKEEQLQANQQQSSLLAAELRDASSTRDRTMSELYHMKLEADALRQAMAEAQAHCVRLERLVEQMKAEAKKEAAKTEEDEAAGDPAVLAELQREVEDLKLRLHMAAEHYKEKYKECQRLQKHVLRLSDQQGDLKRSSAPEASAIPVSVSPDISVPGSPGSADPMLEAIIQEKLKGFTREASDRNDKYRKCKQMLVEEKERSCMFADELAKMEVKFKEQLKMNENMKLQLASDEDRYKSQVAEKGRELKDLKDTLALVVKEKEKVEGELQKGGSSSSSSSSSSSRKGDQGGSEKTSLESIQSSVPLFLQYPVPYTQDAPTPLLVSQSPSKLHFGNPYAISDSKDEDDEEFSDDQLLRLPPVGPPSWDSNVVCIQPTRNHSRPEGHEESEEKQNNNNNGNTNEQPTAAETHSPFVSDGQTAFCFDPSMDMKRCPLCEVIFPPNYDQSKFEEHVESHWKICPMCSEQFPLDCDQKVFENHVLTHFDGHTLNFD